MAKKVICALAIALCAVMSAFSQDNDFKTNTVLIYVGPQFSTAKATGGITGKFSYLAGLQYERNFLKMCGVYVGAEYTSKGTNNFTFLDGRQDDYCLNYVQMNLGLKFAKEIWGIDGFVNAGPYLSYGIGGECTVNGHEMDESSFDDLSISSGMIYTDGGCGFNKFDAGINVAVGAEYRGFRLMFGYQQGLMNIADDNLISNGYKNYGFYAKVGYGFSF
ncbi:MAG: outer membrane beta-barrel protein [Bacteroidales bacterium]|nr:outer membrane beta-barrel protein [Candidatus Liminaster caballi]